MLRSVGLATSDWVSLTQDVAVALWFAVAKAEEGKRG